ncbi:MAG TPA: UDP-N-acetylglucosamine 2-epimerase (non-hydrolyzing), partial [Burkholderiales bacterium]|nr:UDP-N-acetylglucosamine 2-epimerase (non-hydrolyzing) [Burkholderiales bacterium]
HYDERMSGDHLRMLRIPDPDVNLGVGSGSHAVQTAEVMRRFEPVVEREHPVAVIVVGDVNSTLACALVAAKCNVPVMHVEAGLRSHDRSMPEEVNRVLTDQLSELLFTTESSARGNLLREGISETRVHFVGNVMIDTLRDSLPNAVPPRDTLRCHGVDATCLEGGYAVLTLHRPSNVDDPRRLRALLTAVRAVNRRLPVVFAMHPRTGAMTIRHGLQLLVSEACTGLLPPLGYLQMLGLMRRARLVMTDSGGMQEETTALGVPCLTLRENTERPITVEQGTNTVVGCDPVRIVAAADEIVRDGGKSGRTPELWDGRASERIAAVIRRWLERSDDRLVA